MIITYQRITHHITEMSTAVKLSFSYLYSFVSLCSVVMELYVLFYYSFWLYVSLM